MRKERERESHRGKKGGLCAMCISIKESLNLTQLASGRASTNPSQCNRITQVTVNKCQLIFITTLLFDLHAVLVFLFYWRVLSLIDDITLFYYVEGLFLLNHTMYFFLNFDIIFLAECIRVLSNFNHST